MEFTDPVMKKMVDTLPLAEKKGLEAEVDNARTDILGITYASLATSALACRYCDVPFADLLYQIAEQFVKRHPELEDTPGAL